MSACAKLSDGRASASTLLFVYGTLMRGFGLHALLEGRARHLGTGKVAGRLFDLGSYPGALSDALGSITGEVYAIDEPALWTVLDSAEGPQYHRGEVGVWLAGRRQVLAYIYWYVGPVSQAVPIPGGDYRAHVPAKSIYHR